MTPSVISADKLFADYIRCGLIQFGHFEHRPDDYWPVSFHCSMLPSFPSLMEATAQLLVPYFEVKTPRDRLLTMPDTIALGAIVATHTNMPMLYPRRDELKEFTAAFAIEGTADVGNPVILLTDVLLDGKKELEVIKLSERVGLPVKRVVTVLDSKLGGDRRLHQADIQIDTLLSFADVVDPLETDGTLTPHLAKRIRQWIHDQSRQLQAS